MKFLFSCLYILIFFIFNTANLSFAKEDCLAIKKNKVKVEAWLSKKYEKKNSRYSERIFRDGEY